MNTPLTEYSQLEDSWRIKLQSELIKPYFLSLKKFLDEERQQAVIYPPASLVFNAFNQTPFDKVKVVIVGQDPYHNEGQANGLCFSVSEGIKPPPSLKNIFKEMQSDLHVPPPTTGNLVKWAQQGVLLLNTTLTVREHSPASHNGQGWEKFTDAVITLISQQKLGVVFMLWGRHAQSKKGLIDGGKHHILEAAHPSPFSVRNFLGCKHFSQANSLLLASGKEPINWSALD